MYKRSYEELWGFTAIYPKLQTFLAGPFQFLIIFFWVNLLKDFLLFVIQQKKKKKLLLDYNV